MWRKVMFVLGLVLLFAGAGADEYASALGCYASTIDVVLPAVTGLALMLLSGIGREADRG